MTTVKLTSYNMGTVTGRDYDYWIDYVDANIAEQCGFPVDVQAHRFGASVRKDAISADTAEQEETIRETLRSMWDEFCDGAWDAAYKAAGESRR
jgi:hypothetical protein